MTDGHGDNTINSTIWRVTDQAGSGEMRIPEKAVGIDA